MQAEIEIQGTTWGSQGDEDSFFRWLESIPAVKKVTGVHPSALKLELDGLDRLSVYELISLLTRYSINIKPLEKLLDYLTVKDREWFKNPKAYWFNQLFESD